jgi:hypothetical protein
VVGGRLSRLVAELTEWSGGVFRRPFRRVLSERLEVVWEALWGGVAEAVEVVGGASVEGGGGAHGVVRRGLQTTFSEGVERAS